MTIYYLTFQRAPPINVSPDDLINISPTVVNDLRDEIYQPSASKSPLKITLAWIACHENTWRKLADVVEVSWEGPLSAYKPCQIKVPDKVTLRGVKIIHLALWTTQSDDSDIRLQKRRRKDESQRQDWIFDLVNLPYPEQELLVIIPVLSSPIEVLNRSSKSSNTSKSSSTVRLFRIANLPIVEICEESGYELDKHIWDASLYLTLYLQKSLIINKARTVLSILTTEDFSQGLRVVELGSGTGMVTILFSAVLAQVLTGSTIGADGERNQVPAHLTATDLASAIPLLERNILANRGVASDLTIDCQPLDWLEESQTKGTQLILVSDCTYNPTYFKPLCKTIKTLLNTAKEPAICLLAKKHRHIDEEVLWEEVKQHGLQASLLVGTHAVKEGHWGMWKLSFA